MKLKTKKIIAREFLLLVGILVVTFGIYGSLFLYNGVLQLRINSLKGQIQEKDQTRDSLKNTAYPKKKAEQKSFYKDVKERFATNNMANGKDPQSKTYQFLKQKGIKNFPETKEDWINELNQDSVVREKTFNFLKNQGIKNFPETQDKWERELGIKKKTESAATSPTSEKPQVKIRQFYSNLKQAGFSENEIGTIEQFRGAFETKEKASKFYDNLIGTEKVSENEIGTKAKFLNTFQESFTENSHQSETSFQTSGEHPETAEKLLLQDSLNPRKFWQHLTKLQKQDSLSYKWNNQWSRAFKAILKENGITSAAEFSRFIKSNTVTEEDKKNRALVKKLRDESWDLGTKMHHCQVNQLDPQEIWNVAFYSLVGLLGLAYPVRFFVLALRWSILTLRKGGE